MENEGIMGLPEGQDMQNQGSSEALPAVSSADAYDAALTALGSTNPGQLDVYKRAIRQEIMALDLSPAEISALVEMLEYMSQRPAEYSQLRQQLIEQDIIDAEDLPEQYDPAFIGTMLSVLTEMELARGEGATAPMEMGPDMAELPPMGFAEGGLADAAQYLASKGRRGDTMLAHITPDEARMLSAMGGSGTINPETGLPEFFLKKIFKGIKKAFKAVGKAVKKVLKSPIGKIIATIALATVLGPSGLALVSSKAAAGAIASGATTLAAGGNIKDALISSAMGYFGGGGTIGGVNPVSAIAGRVGQFLPGGAEGALAQGIGTGVTGTGIGLVAGMSPEEALRMGATQGVISGGTQAFQNWLASRQAPTTTQPIEEVGTAGEQPPAAPPPLAPEAPPDVRSGMGGDVTGATAPAAPPTGGSAVTYRPTGTSYDIDVSTGRVVTAPPGGITAGVPASVPAGQAVGGGYFSRLGQLVREPSFENLGNLLVDKTATSTIGKYGPGIATGLGVTALAGGFKSEPVNEAPLFERGYSGSDFIRDNPELFQGSLSAPRLEPYDPVVPTPSYGTMPVTQPTTVMPTGVTQSPQGVVQPYNVEGLYGVPLMYPTPPRRYAGGGEVASGMDAYNAAVRARNERIESRMRSIMEANPDMDPAVLQREREYAEQGMLMPNPADYGVSLPPGGIAGIASPAQQPEQGMFRSLPVATQGTSRVDSTDPNYWFEELTRNNPDKDPSYLREAAEIRARQFQEQRGMPASPFAIPAPMGLPATDVANRVYGKFENIAQQPVPTPAMDRPSLGETPLPSYGGMGTPMRSYLPPVPSFSGFNPTSFNPLTVPSFGGYSIPTAYNFGNLSSLNSYNIPQVIPLRFMREGGFVPPVGFSQGGTKDFPRKNGPINGPGTGTSDSIPAMLSDGEFVFTAKAVRNAGGGSRRKGAKRMYSLMKKLEGGPVEA